MIQISDCNTKVVCGSNKQQKCSIMRTKILTPNMRTIMRAKIHYKKNLKFGSCVADKFCGCFKLRFEPLISACLAEVGLICIKDAIGDALYDCTSACAKSILNSNHKLSIYISLSTIKIIYIYFLI